MRESVTFGLIHGGGHGAWCWQRVIDELGKVGYRGIAVDLPCEDEKAGAPEYAEVVVESLSQTEGAVVVVAHSLGGLIAPLVAAARPVRRLIFLNAFLPVPGKSQLDQEGEEPTMRLHQPSGESLLAQRDSFYNTCSIPDADWAMSLLRRQAGRPYIEQTPLDSWPTVACSYIVCGEDRRINPEWQRRVARERLGVDPVEFPGTGHSPFLDRPRELADLLIGLTKTEAPEG